MARRVDANQKDIVKLLRDYGASVFILSQVGAGCPDLIVGIHGKNYLVEVKDGSKPLSRQKLTPHERAFFDSWKGQVCIFRNIEDVLYFMSSINRNLKNG